MSITSCKIQEDGSYHAVINGIDHFFPLNDQEALDRYGVQDWIDAGNTPTPWAGPTALEVWTEEMSNSDREIPRWAEDIFAALPLEMRDAVNAVTKNKIVAKQAKRNSKPV